MVLSRAQLAVIGTARETRSPVNVVMDNSTPDADSFRHAEGQIAADAARAMERARRSLATLIVFIRTRCGRVYGFRFKDWTDYQALTQHSPRK